MAEVKATVIDVSKFNVVTDYMKASKPIDGVIIRAGYRSLANTGKLMTDPSFEKHYKGFFPYVDYMGVYFFTTAINVDEAVQEADYCLNLIRGKNINLPIMVDSEYTNTTHSGRSDKLNRADRTKYIKAFCDRIIEKGYPVGIYASDSWFVSNLDYAQIKNYYLWVASYSKPPSRVKNYVAWQYTSKYVLPGVTKPVDCSKWYVDLASVCKVNSVTTPVVEKKETVIKESEKVNNTNDNKLTTGKKVELNNAGLYTSSGSKDKVRDITGTYYIWNDSVVKQKIRITNSPDNVGIVGKITGWIKVEDIK